MPQSSNLPFSCTAAINFTGLALNSIPTVNFFPTDLRAFTFQVDIRKLPTVCEGITYDTAFESERSQVSCGPIVLHSDTMSTIYCPNALIPNLNDGTTYGVAVTNTTQNTYDSASAFFKVTKQPASAALCASTVTFPQHQDAVSYAYTDADPITELLQYNKYECAPSYTATGNFASTSSAANAPSPYGISSVAIQGDADANWFDTAQVTGTVQGVTKGSIPDGQYQAGFTVSNGADRATVFDAPVTISHTGAAPPTPSQANRKRQQLIAQAVIMDRPEDLLCGPGYNACPVPGVGWECAEANNDIDSCGGCLSTHTDVDCTSIAGAVDLSCVQGACQVHSCDEAHVLVSSTYCEPPTERLGRILSSLARRD